MIHFNFNSNLSLKPLLLLAALLMNVGVMKAWKGYAKLTAKTADQNMGLVAVSTSNSTPSSSSFGSEKSATQKGSKTGSEPKTFYAFYQEKTGYHFTSWSRDNLYSFDKDGNPCTVKVQTSTAGLTNTGTVTANFAINTYTVAFNGNGSTSGSRSTQSFTYGTAQKLNSCGFSKTGYHFDGWEDRSTITYNGTSWPYTTFDMPYYANTYSDLMNAFGYDKIAQLNHYINNGKGEGRSCVGSTPGLYPNQATVNNLTATNGQTIELYAHWTVNTYTITFNGNGSTSGSMSNIACTYGITYTLTATAYKRPGYEFAGWNTKADGTGSSYSNGQSVSNLTATNGGTVTLYAQWKPIFNFSATANKNEGANNTVTATVANSSITGSVGQTSASTTATFTATADVANSYMFEGWYPNSSYNTSERITTNTQYQQTITNSDPTQTANLTLYAKFVQKLTPEIAGSDQTLNVDGTYTGFTFSRTSATKPSLNGDFYYAITENTPSGITTGSEHASEIIGYDPATNTLMAYNAGTAKITFGQKAVGVYVAKSVTYTITVSKIANALDASINVTALNPDGTATISLTGTQNNTATDIVYSITSQTLDANNQVLNPNDQTNVVTNNGNVFTAVNVGAATVTVSQAESYKYTGFSKEFTLTVSKIDNTLAIKPAQTILIEGTISDVYSNKNSDGEITSDTTIISLSPINNGDGQVISYDLASNTITAHNAGEAKLTLKQAETYKYAAAEKDITVTVNKWSNTIYINGTANSLSFNKTYNETQSITLTATNTDYAGSALTVNQVQGTDVATYTSGQFTTLYNGGTASWSVSQPENAKYESAVGTFSVNVGNVIESTDCYVLQADDEVSYGKNGDKYYKDFSFNVDAPGAVLSIDVWKYSSWNDIGIRIYGYDAAGNQTTIKEFSIGDMNTSATNYSFPIDENIRKIRVQNGGGEWASCSTLNTYAKNIRVTRKTYITASAAKTDLGKRYVDGAALSTNLTVNWSESNGGDIHIVSDNDKFSVGQSTITNTSCNGGTTTIPVTYTTTEAGTHTATITIYNDVKRATVNLTATTIRHDQTLSWSGDQGLDYILLDDYSRNTAATATSGLPVTYSSSDENYLTVDASGNLTPVAVTPAGTTVTITASQAGNDKYNAATSLTRTYTVTKLYTGCTLTLAAKDGNDVYWATYSNADYVTFWPTSNAVVKMASVQDSILTLPVLDSVEATIDDETLRGYFVPANTGVLIKSLTGNTVTYYVVLNHSVDELADNMLHPGKGETAAAPGSGSYKYYMLAYKAGTSGEARYQSLGFYWGADQGAAFASRKGGAYLAVPTTATGSVALRGFSFGDAVEPVNPVVPIEPDEPDEPEQPVQTAIDENDANSHAEKFFLGGRLYIRRAGHIYDLSGHLIR